jgi:hypothetical protein
MPTQREKLEVLFPDEDWAFIDENTPFYVIGGVYHIDTAKWPVGLPVWTNKEVKEFLES